MSKWYVGAYWGPRTESIDEYTKRLARLIVELAQVDPTLSGWRDKGRSEKEARSNPVVTEDHSDLSHRLATGQLRGNGGEPVPDAGYTVTWWNGAENNQSAANLTVACGGRLPRVPNRVLLNLPDPQAAPKLYELAAARRLLSSLITLFSPDWATWSARDLREKQAEPDRPLEGGGYIVGEVVGIPAGWATYLADDEPTQFDRQSLPSSATVERLGDGTLVLIGNDPVHPPVIDVLAVRAAMGYNVIQLQETIDQTTPSIPGHNTQRCELQRSACSETPRA